MANQSNASGRCYFLGPWTNEQKAEFIRIILSRFEPDNLGYGMHFSGDDEYGFDWFAHGHWAFSNDLRALSSWGYEKDVAATEALAKIMSDHKLSVALRFADEERSGTLYVANGVIAPKIKSEEKGTYGLAYTETLCKDYEYTRSNLARLGFFDDYDVSADDIADALGTSAKYAATEAWLDKYPYIRSAEDAIACMYEDGVLANIEVEEIIEELGDSSKREEIIAWLNERPNSIWSVDDAIEGLYEDRILLEEKGEPFEEAFGDDEEYAEDEEPPGKRPYGIRPVEDSIVDMHD